MLHWLHHDKRKAVRVAFSACLAVMMSCLLIAMLVSAIRTDARMNEKHSSCYEVNAPESCKQDLLIDKRAGQIVSVLLFIAFVCSLPFWDLHHRWFVLNETLLKNEREEHYRQWLDALDVEYHLRMAMRADVGRTTDPVICARIDEAREIGKKYGIVVTRDEEQGKGVLLRRE